jgi:hypothetical protein
MREEEDTKPTRSWWDCPTNRRCSCINAGCCWYVVSDCETIEEYNRKHAPQRRAVEGAS